jgi:predicted MFS family arabinose efflux permease
MSPAESPQPVGPTPKRGALNRLFSAFAYRDFRLVWFGAFTSTCGTWMQQTAQGWLVFKLTGGSLYVGLDAALGTIPILLFSLIGGVVADRFDRRRILLASQVLQLVFAFTLAALAYGHVQSVWPILLISFLTGSAQAFGGPAYQALMPALVEGRAVANAIALNSMQFNLARMIGPVLGGVALAAFGADAKALDYSGVALCFALNGASFLAVIVSLMLLRVRPAERAPAQHLRHDLGEGLKFVLHREALRSLTLISLSSTLFGLQFITFLPVFAERFLGTGAGGYSALLSISGAGSVVGSLVAAWLGEVKYKGRIVLMLQIAAGLMLTIFAVEPTMWLAYPLVFLASGCLVSTFSLTASLVQLLVSDNIRGRVMSVYFVAFRGGAPLGNLLTGSLAERFSLAYVLAGNGLALCLVAAGYLFFSKSKVNEH